jgi:hypothetical protein
LPAIRSDDSLDFGWYRVVELWNRSVEMKTTQIVLVVVCFLCLSHLAFSQAAGGQFQLTKITKNLITTPQYTYTGAQQYTADQRDRWLEVEVEFAAAPLFTDELTFRYFILVNGKVLTGEVTHTNIAGGQQRRSVMYVPPQGLARALDNRPVSATSVQNIAVQIVQQGAVKDELSLSRAAPQWYKTVPALSGLVLNKNETPFAPLYWNRYEQIKSLSH